MAVIVFVSDFAVGHLYPTLGLADALRQQGHRVCYLGIADMAEAVRRRGFDFYTIFEDVYPSGTVVRMSQGALVHNRKTGFNHHVRPLLEGALDDVVRRLAPDVLIVSLFLSLEALTLFYKYRIPIVIFTEYLRAANGPPAAKAVETLMSLDGVGYELLQTMRSAGASGRGLIDLARPLTEAPELIACPRELDLPNVDRGPRVHYLGPSIRGSAPEVGPALPEPPPGTKLIYVSLGSQAGLLPTRAESLYRRLFEVVRDSVDEDWHFVVSIGGHLEPGRFGPLPDNLTVVSWAPQLALLQRAALMITHGGLGSVKEAIHCGVPMVVVPLVNDQPANAERVEYHRLGARLDTDRFSPGEMGAAIRMVLASQEIAAATARMSAIFEESDRSQIGPRVIGEITGTSASPA
ncbi:MAG: hypothetical protein HC897_16720 [Thermoanaerobaculia bacterium]|nr:hypothetical protein [Thermoanaerobaculia bacterium]